MHTRLAVPLPAIRTAAPVDHQPAPAPAVVLDADTYAALAQRADTRVSGRAKDVAVASAGIGVGLGAAGTGVGVGAGMIAASAPGLMTAALALAIGTGSVTALVLVLKHALGTARRGPSTDAGSTAAAPVHTTHVHVTATASGAFGRASATVTPR